MKYRTDNYNNNREHRECDKRCRLLSFYTVSRAYFVQFIDSLKGDEKKINKYKNAMLWSFLHHYECRVCVGMYRALSCIFYFVFFLVRDVAWSTMWRILIKFLFCNILTLSNASVFPFVAVIYPWYDVIY